MSEVVVQNKDKENKETAPELIFAYLATAGRGAVYELFGDVAFDIENAIISSERLTEREKTYLGIVVGRIEENVLTLRELEEIAYLMGDDYYTKLKDRIVDTVKGLIEAYFATYYGRPYSEVDSKLFSISQDLRDEINYLINELSKKIYRSKS